MNKFNINKAGNFNIYGEVIPINAFYGKVGNEFYYCLATSVKDVNDIRKNVPLVNGVLPLPVYVWHGEKYGFVLKWDYGRIASTIMEHATRKNAWNGGIKRDIAYGIGRTMREKSDFMTSVVRKHKSHAIKDGSTYAAKNRHKNVGEIPLDCGECVIARTFNTGRSFSKNDL